MGAAPPKVKPYRVPLEKQEETRKQIQYHLDNELTEPSSSPFRAPTVLVKKADKRLWRSIVNYRKLDSVIRKKADILPNIQYILDQASGKRYYSTLDFQTGFFQILVEEKHKERTTFPSFLGRFNFV